MAEKKVRTRVKKPIVKEVGEVKQIEEKSKAKETRNYLECPFCHVKNYVRSGRDEASSWCIFCGRCFPAIWKEENC